MSVVHIPAGKFTVKTDPSDPLTVTGTFAAQSTFLFNGASSYAIYSASAASANRGIPSVILAGEGEAPVDVGAGSATATTLRVADAIAYQRMAGNFVPAAFDYVSANYGSTTDTWTYKTGGATGTTVKTVVVSYTDSSKTYISTIAAT